MDPALKTERLLLRPFTPADAPHVRELVGVWAVASMLAVVPHPYPEGAAETWIAGHERQRREGGYPLAICLDGKLAGCVGVEHPQENGLELGYWIGVPYWGRGFATEAARAAADFAFDVLRKDHLRSGHLVENAASARVLAKLGFVTTGRAQCQCLARGAPQPGVRLLLKREDYRAKMGITTP